MPEQSNTRLSEMWLEHQKELAKSEHLTSPSEELRKYEEHLKMKLQESERKPRANEHQVGGGHYQSSIQHWDYVLANNIPYMEAQIIKYVTRWKKKGGITDLEKARHFLEKLIEYHSPDPTQSIQGVQGWNSRPISPYIAPTPRYVNQDPDVRTPPSLSRGAPDQI